MFRAFGNSARLLPFARSVAFKTVGVILVFSAAMTSRAQGVIVVFRFLGHVKFLLQELMP